MSDDDKKQTAVWTKPSRPKEGLTEEQMLDALESALDARADKGKARPEAVDRFRQWHKDARTWMWWMLRHEPTTVIVGLGGLLFASTMAMEFVISEGYVDPEDFPFATQGQHTEAMCEVRAGRIEVCSLKVAIGQLDGPCPTLPDSCSSVTVLE